MSAYELALANLLAAADSMVAEAKRIAAYVIEEPYSRDLFHASIRLGACLKELRDAAPEVGR